VNGKQWMELIKQRLIKDKTKDRKVIQSLKKIKQRINKGCLTG